MTRRAVRDLRSTCSVPRRVFDVIADRDELYLEIKTDKKTVTIDWKDVVYQVEAARSQEMNNSHL